MLPFSGVLQAESAAVIVRTIMLSVTARFGNAFFLILLRFWFVWILLARHGNTGEVDGRGVEGAALPAGLDADGGDILQEDLLVRPVEY